MLSVHDIILARSLNPALKDTDGERVALCLDSGGMKGAVIAGMAAAIEELGLTDCFDAVYGSSAGCLIGAYLLDASAAGGEEIFWRHLSGRRFVRPALTIIGGALNMDYLFDAVILKREPISASRAASRSASFHPLIANRHSGHAVDASTIFNLASQSDFIAALRASVRAPLVCGNPWSKIPDLWRDAGLYEPIPYQTPLAAGATRMLLLRSAPAGHVPNGSLNKLHGFAGQHLPYPLTGSRQSGRGAQNKLLAEAQPGSVKQIFPSEALQYSFFCRDSKMLQQYALAGRKAIREWWHGSQPSSLTAQSAQS
jgi:predicted patatin/cPLA2 family phospholipase